MRALQIQQFGPPSVLRLVEVPDPVPSPGNAVVQVTAASINPSDVVNVAGRFPQTTLPRVPGRDYAGTVIAGPAEWIGKRVWGSGGDTGFTRDGTHAEFLEVPVASLTETPSTLSDAEAASIGVTFIAAWCGIIEYAHLAAGETLAVIGAAGGVGSAGIQIGRSIGAKVFGVDRAPASLADAFVTGDNSAEQIRNLTHGRGVDVVLNAVGGPTFEPGLKMLAHHGRMAILASPAQRQVPIDVLDFYHNESQMFGVDTLRRDLTASAKILRALSPGFENGSLKAPVIHSVVPLEQAVAAYTQVAEGASGRVVLAPGLIATRSGS